jgi:uncharacterized protein
MDDPKLQVLREIVRDMGSVLIAYSGGVDSTLLLSVARDVLGDSVVAVTGTSPTYRQQEYDQARQLAERVGVRHITIASGELDLPEFLANPPDRCYHCKRELFSRLMEVARREGVSHVADGANADDAADFRPGMQAAGELGIRSPLKEAGLTKQDIRLLSKGLGLPTWDKPSMACLASRFPYGDRITPEALRMVAEAEDCLRGLGFDQVRVRHRRDLASIEVPASELGRFADQRLREDVVDRLRAIGYVYVTLDLRGYRSGSMNEALGESDIADH